MRLVAACAAAWMMIAAALLLRAGWSADAGMRVVDEVEAAASPSMLLSGEASGQLRRAQEHFEEARGDVRSPFVSPLRALPVIGRQLRSVDALAKAAAEVSGVGAEALEEARERIERGAAPGPQRARLIADLGEVARSTEQRLGDVDLGPGDALVGPLAQRRREAAAKLDEVRGRANSVAVAVAGFARLLESGDRYLMLVANNAEMRAGSGMFLTAGPLSFTDGRVEVGTLEPTADLLLEEAVPVPGDLAERWGWMQPGREWRNLGVSPRFDVTAPLAARMWERARGEEIDGVLAVDVIALQALLAAVGPIDVLGGRIDAGNVENDLLHDQYVGEDIDALVQSERSPRLAAVAAAAVQALERPDLDVARLVGELARAAQGRHLLAWSSQPADQEAWEAAGVDGSLGEDDLLLAVLNRGGNKLDPYLDIAAHLEVEHGPAETRFSVTIQLSSSVGADEPPYIAGPHPSLDVDAGTYVGLVAVSLPAEAAAGRFDGIDQLAAAGRDGPTRVVAAPLTLPRGETRFVTLRFELPPGSGALDVLADARVPPSQWQADGRTWEADHAERIVW
jgi:hypothetical protein